MSPNGSPMPDEADVHLSVFLHGVRLDFVACVTAALRFIEDHRARHYVDAVHVIPGDTTGLARLPNERLFLEPSATTLSGSAETPTGAADEWR
ncbi:hypothetical protein [Nocardia sp. NBC_01009]|uniref:hypothetical protein n=1 Tax=Nocardia sp. NBC_01009 TaxID=2975996 RepID=UPI003865D270|nr:hypothetical protein OHA42_14275 [Nocardia sp. NBC_01009]